MRRAIIDKLIKPFFTPRFLKFATVGASGVFVNLGFLALFKALGVQINLASALAIELSLISNFLINHAWTFRDKRAHAAGILTQAARFHLVCLVGAGFQFLGFVIMNMVWLLALFDASTVTAYHQAAGTWAERWLWHPFVDPPDVGSWVYLSQLMGIALGTVWNYLLNFYWTWAARTGRAEADVMNDVVDPWPAGAAPAGSQVSVSGEDHGR